MKVNARICAPATDRYLARGLGKSTSVNSRKVVNNAKAKETLVEARSDTVCVCVCSKVCVCVCVFSGVGNVLFRTCSRTLNGQDQVVTSCVQVVTEMLMTC